MPVSPEAKELEALLSDLGSKFPGDGNPFLQRCIYDQVHRAGAECPNVTLRDARIRSDRASGGFIGGIGFQPVGANAESGRAILFMHGGGYTFGSPNGHRKLTAHLAFACNCTALSVDYRMSPEHKFPAALDDCVAGYKHLLELGFNKIVVAGDSCGGGLSTAVPLALARQGLPMPVASVSLSPWYDKTTVEGGTMDSNEEVDVLNAKPFITMLAERYVDDSGSNRDYPLISPLHASDEELAKMPPHWISCAGCDMLCDHGTRMGERLKKVGVEAAVEVHEGLQHVFEFGVGKVPEADKSIKDIGVWVKQKFGS